MFSYVAKDKMTENDFSSFIMSCQDESLHMPDTQTLGHMKEVSAEALKTEDSQIEIQSVDSVPLGRGANELSPDQLSLKRMASNCAPSFRLMDVTSYNKFTCHYTGSGLTESGQSVVNQYQKWSGTLPSCEGGMELDKSTIQDVKKLAYHAAGGDKAGLDVDKFICKVYSLPANM